MADYRERAIECLELARTTRNQQTKAWAVEFACLLQRLSTATARKSGRESPDSSTVGEVERPKRRA